MIPCPRCAAAVQPDWDWCHACGYDPEGLRPGGGPAAPPNATRPPAATPTGPAPRYAPPPYAPAPYGGAHRGASGYGAPKRSGAATAVKVVLITGTALLALFVVLVAAVALLGTTPTNQVGTVAPSASTPGAPGEVPWTTWSAPDGTFHLDFPVSPRSEPMAINDPKFGGGALVMADLGSSGYMLAYFDPSAEYAVTDPSAVLNGAIDGMAHGTGMTMDSRTPGTFGYLPSIDFSGHVADDRQGFNATGTVFTSARRTFVLMTLYKTDVLVEHDRFVQSFVTG